MYSILFLIIVHVAHIYSSRDRTLNVLKRHDIGKGEVVGSNLRGDNLLYCN